MNTFHQKASETAHSFLVSEMAGRSTLELKAKEIGIDLDGKILGDVVEVLKKLEYEGYHFEVADASLELLMRGQADGPRTSST